MFALFAFLFSSSVLFFFSCTTLVVLISFCTLFSCRTSTSLLRRTRPWSQEAQMYSIRYDHEQKSVAFFVLEVILEHNVADQLCP